VVSSTFVTQVPLMASNKSTLNFLVGKGSLMPDPSYKVGISVIQS